MGHSDKSNNTTSAKIISPTPSSFNRSLIFYSYSAAEEEAEITTKPLYSLYNTPSLQFQRSGSFKSLYSSPFGSMVSAGNSLKGKVRKLCSIFESPKETTPSPMNSLSSPPSQSQSTTPMSVKPSKLLLPSSKSPNFSPKSAPFPVPDLLFRLPGTEDRVVIYFISLGGIRKTFQDGHSIRMIFRGLRVNLDERDVSMDVAYKKELQRALGETNITLPDALIKGKYIGGADVIRQLLEAGELVRLIIGLPLKPPMPCKACGDMRFIPCTYCNGSRKVFDEDNEQLKRCMECNENGLERCPLCCI